MKRVIVYFSDKYCNLSGDRLVEDTQYLRVFAGDQLIGMFDVAAVDVAYISEKRDEDK